MRTAMPSSRSSCPITSSACRCRRATPGQARRQGARQRRPHGDDHQDLPGQRSTDPGEPDRRGRQAGAGPGKSRVRGGHLSGRQPGRELRRQVLARQGSQGRSAGHGARPTPPVWRSSSSRPRTNSSVKPARPARHRIPGRQAAAAGAATSCSTFAPSPRTPREHQASQRRTEQPADGRERPAAARQGDLPGRRSA